MPNYTQLKKEVAERNTRDICSKISNIIGKYQMSQMVKDELLQVADMVATLKHKIHEI